MIGNDIVDLSIAKVGEGIRRIRFLKKIFIDVEIERIIQAPKEDFHIWLMWSIKESVYKIIARQENRIRYAPKSICCQSVIQVDHNSYESTVAYDGQTFTARSSIHGDCIHTIASNKDVLSQQIQSASFETSAKWHSSLFLDQKVIKALDDPQDNLKNPIRIQRDKMRIPHIYKGEEEMALLSLSRHGRFEGYAFLQLEE